MIVLDTSILSLAFRRRQRTEPEPYPVAALRRMVVEDVPLAIPGIVLQELLSGVRSDRQFSRLRNLLEPFAILMPNKPITSPQRESPMRAGGRGLPRPPWIA
jgi:predicted nucleic acid-binding protein